VKTKRPIQTRDPRGRKKTGKAIRTSKVQLSMTPEDAEWLNEFAVDAGFVSRSQLLTAIIERLILCKFSGVGALRMAIQIQEKLHQNLKVTGKTRHAHLDWNSLLLRPLPPLPENAPLDPDLIKGAIEELNATKPKGKK